jgi:peptide/nickel transport system ATP-binding protein
MGDALVGTVGTALASESVASVDGLAIAFRSGERWVEVVSDVSFEVRRGEVLGMVGESGSGKTVSALALLGLTETLGGRVVRGRLRFDGRDLSRLTEREWLGIRGVGIGMIFQQPQRSLDPAFTVGEQIAETIRAHKGLSRRAAWARAVELLERVRIADAHRRAHDYPHMFSGGMAQRVMIAIALSCDPKLLIADEPTTALDVTVQSHILELLREIRADSDLSVLYITHDLAVVAEICDRVAVLYAGQTQETAGVRDLITRPRHPYTAGLLRSVEGTDESGRLAAIQGAVPRPDQLGVGCRFAARCDHALPVCSVADVDTILIDPSRSARCIRVDELSLAGYSVPTDAGRGPADLNVSGLRSPASADAPTEGSHPHGHGHALGEGAASARL